MRGGEITVGNLINAAFNSGFGFRSYKPKIFLIGFNKCGTTSLHKFFHAQGLKSVHCLLNGQPLAIEVSQCVDVQSCRKTFAHGQVFSDFTFLTDKKFCEPIDMYPLWRQAFPDAYFIFNTRDVDSWLRSRVGHSNGTFLKRYMSLFDQTEEEVLLQWRSKFLTHTKNVLSFFENDEQFCQFKVGQDNIGKIVTLLAADYRLDAAMFGHVNSKRTSG
jgi:hypothetical protein